MNDDLAKFNDIDGLKEKHEAAKQEAAINKQRFSMRKEALQGQVSLLSKKYDTKKERLATDETAMQLDQLEQKLRGYQSSNFHTQEFVNAKKKESDYQLSAMKSYEIIDKINAALIEQAQPKYN